MIPILYDKTETVFSSNGLGRLRDCISCLVTEERNGIYECEFKYPTTGAHYNEIVCGRIIAVEHDDTGDVQPFDIISRSNPINGVVTFTAVHISYRLNKITTALSEINTLEDALTAIKSQTTPSNPFNFTSDFSSSGFLAIGDGLPVSVRTVLGGAEGSILDTYGGEYKFDKWNVELYASRGIERDYMVRYGVNLTEYNEDIDYSNTFTQVIPYWSNGTEKVVGDVVTYPGRGYTGRDECVPYDVSSFFESKPTKAEVETLAQTRLNAVSPIVPEQNINIEFIKLSDTPEYKYIKDLQRCELCDTITVIFPLYDMTGQFKIVKTVWDVLLERYEEMELGTLSTTLSEALGVSSGGGGSVSVKTDCGVTSDYTQVSSSGNQDVQITFNASFSTVPTVVCMLYDVQTDAGAVPQNNAHQLVVQLKSVTKTGAVFNIRNNGSAVRRARLSWIAAG